MKEDLLKDSEDSEGRALYRTLVNMLIKLHEKGQIREHDAGRVADLVEIRALYQLALYGKPAQYQPNYGAGSDEEKDDKSGYFALVDEKTHKQRIFTQATNPEQYKVFKRWEELYEEKKSIMEKMSDASSYYYPGVCISCKLEELLGIPGSASTPSPPAPIVEAVTETDGSVVHTWAALSLVRSMSNTVERFSDTAYSIKIAELQAKAEETKPKTTAEPDAEKALESETSQK